MPNEVFETTTNESAEAVVEGTGNFQYVNLESLVDEVENADTVRVTLEGVARKVTDGGFVLDLPNGGTSIRFGRNGRLRSTTSVQTVPGSGDERLNVALGTTVKFHKTGSVWTRVSEDKWVRVSTKNGKVLSRTHDQAKHALANSSYTLEHSPATQE